MVNEGQASALKHLPAQLMLDATLDQQQPVSRAEGSSLCSASQHSSFTPWLSSPLLSLNGTKRRMLFACALGCHSLCSPEINLCSSTSRRVSSGYNSAT